MAPAREHSEEPLPIVRRKIRGMQLPRQAAVDLASQWIRMDFDCRASAILMARSAPGPR
jgi:hypothetical protein